MSQAATLYKVIGRIVPEVRDGVKTVRLEAPARFSAREGILKNAPFMVGVRIRQDLDEIPVRMHNRHGARDLLAAARKGELPITLGRRVFREGPGFSHQIVEGDVITSAGLELSSEIALYVVNRYPTLLEIVEKSELRKGRSKK